MTLVLMWLALVGALAIAERSVERLAFAVSALVAVAAALLLLVADLERATLLSGLVAAAIIGASRVKYHHSGMKLTVADFALVFAGTIPFLLKQYTRAATGVLATAVCLVVAAVLVGMYVAGPPFALSVRAAIFAVAVGTSVMAYRMSGGAVVFRQLVTQPRNYFSTFMASLIDTQSWWPSRALRLIDLADEPMPLLAAMPAHHAVRPDIIIIQHESVFDPRIFGLAIEPEIEAFLSPSHGVYGGLRVGIFGGGSWQSEFSLLTGLGSAAFGPDAYFIFKKGAGRFRHSLPLTLSALGYKTMLVASCRRGFFNYDAFYGSIGMHERIFSDDLAAPFDVDRFEATYSDATFMPAAFNALAETLGDDPRPRFLYALTNFNHGPHGSEVATDGRFARARAFALKQCADEQYVDYYARLTETAATWQESKSRLAAAYPHRPMLIVHYGDHQPVLTRRLEHNGGLNPDKQRQFRTFFAIESVNFDLDDSIVPKGTSLDIAALGSMVLKLAGLPLDQVTATQASLHVARGQEPDQMRLEMTNQFHRTLVDLHLIDLSARGCGSR
jgi:hypothetical protein